MQKTIISFLALYMILFLESPVYAYLDPGSGSMILQLLLGAIAGVAVFFKFFWRKFLSVFRLGRKAKDNTEEIDTDQ